MYIADDSQGCSALTSRLPSRSSGSHAAQLRKEAGAWLKSLREAAGLTQQSVATDVGITNYRMISQIESGKATIRPSQYEAYADTLGVPPDEFMIKLLSYYDPYAYNILFGSKEDR